jgi:hypothetical protein
MVLSLISCTIRDGRRYREVMNGSSAGPVSGTSRQFLSSARNAMSGSESLAQTTRRENGIGQLIDLFILLVPIT